MVSFDVLVKVIVEHIEVNIDSDIDIDILSQANKAASALYEQYDVQGMSRSEVEQLVEQEVTLT